MPQLLRANKQCHMHSAAFVYPRCTVFSFHCSSWNTCRTNVQRGGCSFDDILVQVLQYRNSRWRPYYYLYNIQRYKDITESLNHLCSNIAPGTYIRHSISTHTSKVTYINCILFSFAHVCVL